MPLFHKTDLGLGGQYSRTIMDKWYESLLWHKTNNKCLQIQNHCHSYNEKYHIY